VRRLLSGRLGALVEREYRLLFSATVVTSLGDAIAQIALASRWTAPPSSRARCCSP
jgi:hypothetical protein